MKKKILLSLILIFLFNKVIAQNHVKNNNLDKEILNRTKGLQTELYFKKAVTFFVKENWDSTIVYSSKQITVTKKNLQFLDYCHFFKGFSFKQKKLLIEAEKEFLKISKNFHFKYLIKSYLGEITLEQRQFKKAIPYFKDLIKLPQEKSLFLKKTSNIHNLGLCYLHTKQFKKAEFFLNQSVNFHEKEKDTIELIGSYGDLANLYYEQYKDNLAIPYFQKAYIFSKSTNNNQLKINTALNMSVVEENRKDFKKALAYRKEAQQWKDSLNDQNKIYAVAQKEKEFAVKQKQNEVDILQVQNELKETQRTIFLYAAIGLFVLLGVSLYFYREKVKRNKIIANQKENLDALNATKDKLFSIVSHDLRSSVNALKTSNGSLVKNLDSNNLSALRNLLQKNSAIVNGAYGLLDNLLNWALLQTNQGYFSISSLRLFFITEQVSYNYQPLLLEKELSLENTVSKKDIVFADQESLKIVLRNLLDNAIKFSKPNGSIKIYSQNSSDDFCDLIIEDTGLGMSEATRLELLKDTALLHKKEHEDVIGTGLGLQLCKSMIRKNNGKFDIESELGKGTKMIVSLPKNPSNE